MNSLNSPFNCLRTTIAQNRFTHLFIPILIFCIAFSFNATAQFCPGSPLPAGQIDHRDCGAGCTANDVELLGLSLSAGDPCLTCVPGEIITLDLIVTVNHGTNSNRPALTISADLDDGSGSTCDFVRCDGPIIRNGDEIDDMQDIGFGTIEYTCGSVITLSDILISWGTPSESCPLACPTSKCSAVVGEFVIRPPLVAPFPITVTPSCDDADTGAIDFLIQSGTPDYTVTISGGSLGAPMTITTIEPVSFTNLGPGTYTIDIDDAEGCMVTTDVIVTAESCCEFDAICNLITDTQFLEGCDASVLPAVITNVDDVFEDGAGNAALVCTTPLFSSEDFSTGTLCDDVVPLQVTRIYTLTDDLNGNGETDGGEPTATCQETYVIDDTTPPTITCPDSYDVACESDLPGGIAVPADIADDNCFFDIDVDFGDYNGDDCGGSQIITYTAIDGCGNSTPCTQTITVTGSPIVITNCPVAGSVFDCTDILLDFTEGSPDAVGFQNIDVFLANGGTVAGFCGNVQDLTVTLIDDLPPNLCAPSDYIITRTTTISDPCGNSDSCSDTYTILVNDPPVPPAPPAEVNIQCATDVPAPISLTATDACDGDITVAPDDQTIPGDCPNTFTIERTWTFVNSCGKSASTSQTINVNDTTPPTITCPDPISVACVSDVQACVSSDATADDNCGTVNVTCTQGTYTGDDCGGSIINTYTAEDPCGNSTPCTQTITVTGSPIVITNCPVAGSVFDCTDILLDFTEGSPDAVGFQNIDVFLANGGTVAGFCGNVQDLTVTLIDDLPPNLCAPSDYIITRTTTISDPCGNSDSCSDTYTILVNDPPVPPAPPAEVNIQCATDVPAPISLTATDACDGDITVAPDDQTIPGDCPNTFTIERTWTFVNSCGKSASTSQTINVNDDTPPVAPAPPADVTEQCAAAILPPVDLTATDNCDGDIVVSPTIDITPGNCPNSFTEVRTWTFVDECGNTSEVQQTINVNDDTPPVAPAPPADVTEQCAAAILPPVDLTATDNCDGDIVVSPTIDITPGNCPNSFTEVRTWTFMDQCGNTSEVQQTINVNDNTPPVAPAPPADVTTQCAALVLDPVDLTANDNCDPDITVSPTIVITPGTSVNSFIEVRTWTFVDACGNTTEIFQTITVDDDSLPMTPTPPADINEQCSANVPGPIDLTATDNCDPNITVSPTINIVPGNCPNSYTETRTWTFVDINGNTSVLAQNINVNDDIAPVAPAPPVDVTEQCDAAVPAPIDLTAVDNCDGDITVSPTIETTPGACANSYTEVRTWTFTDACGNTSEVSQTINVNDDTNPIAPTPPADITEQCGADVPAPVDLTAVDNCDGDITVSPTIETTPGACANSYTEVRTWTFTDACGNSSEISQTINVNDDMAPVAPTPPADVNLQCAPGVPDPVDLTAVDNCDGNITVSPTDVVTQGNCPNNFSIVRTWTFTDACGNESSISQNINSLDDTAPTAPTPPADVTGQCASEVPDAIDLLFFENCGGEVSVSPTEETTSGNCPNSFTIVRTWSLTDDCGLTSSVSQTIAINDDMAPVTPAPPANFDGQCAADLPAPVMLTAVDNCDGEITVSPVAEVMDGPCPNSFIMVRTWTFTDDCGNTSSVSQTLNINDDTAPDAPTAPADVMLQCAAELPAPQTLTAIDNCDGDITVSPTAVVTDGNCPNSFTMVRTWTFVDGCGNESSVSQTIEVNDDTAPVAPAAPADLELDCADEVPLISELAAQDNCDGTITDSGTEVLTPGACPNSFSIFRTWTFTDGCGNTSSVSQTINVSDDDPPVFDTPPADLNLQCAADVPAPVDLIATDNCEGQTTISPTEVTTPGDCADRFVIVRTWTTNDDCGNEASVSQTITVNDNTGPTFGTAPQDEIVECGTTNDADFQTWLANFAGAVATDNCNNSTLSFDPNFTFAPDCGNAGVYNVTFIATDDCGNETTATASFIIEDTTDPVFTSVPDGLTFECDETAEIPNATATDGCNDVNVSFTVEIIPGDCSNNYDLVRVWLATDACGNTAEATTVITIQDTTPPIIEAEANDLTVECDGEGNQAQLALWLQYFAGADATDACGNVEWSYGNPVVTDLCGGTGIYTYTFTATDNCGNTASTSADFTIIDTTDPDIMTPPMSIQTECNGTSSLAAFNDWVDNYGYAEASDLCGDVTWTIDPANPVFSETCGGSGNVVVTFTATDDCGNDVSFIRGFIVVDTTPPLFTSVPADRTIECPNEPEFGNPSGTDICGSVSFSYVDETTEGSCASEYSVTRTWTITDECGNEGSSESQTIYVEDTNAPTLVFVDSLLIGIQDGGTITFSCGDTQVFTPAAVEAVDNCNDDPTICIIDNVSFEADEDECGPNGLVKQITCKWTAKDECGNETSITIFMNYVDDVAPYFTSFPDDVTVNCGQDGNYGMPTAEDDCHEFVSITSEDNMGAGNCADGMQMIRTWTLLDVCGNTTSQDQIITMIDAEAPVFTSVPDNNTISCDDSVVFGEAMATDNCGDVSISSETTVDDSDLCNTIHMITWTATDMCGNETTASQSITQTDTENPTFNSTPQNLFIDCDTDPIPFDDPQATDNCGIASISFTETPPNGDCTTGFTVTRTWTATDDCGNETTISQTATAAPAGEETEMRFTYTPPNMTISCGDEMAFGAPVGQTSCEPFELTYNDVTAEGDCENAYSVTRTWTAIDDCNNDAVCQQTIYVIDNAPPIFTFVPENETLNCAQEINFGSPTCEDLCGHVAEVTFEDYVVDGCGSSYSIIRTWSSTDNCGNTAFATQSLTISDNEGPVFNTNLVDKTIDCNQVVLFDTPTAVDACSGIFTLDYSDQVSDQNCSVNYVVTRTWIARDECGNETTIDQTITRPADNLAPEFIFVCENKEVNCGSDVIFEAALANDNCSNVTMTYEDVVEQGSCANSFTTTRTWTATDDCGNANSVARSITYMDDQAPAFTELPNDIEVTCAADISFADVTANDNCGGNVAVSFEDNVIENGCMKVFTRTWTATDDCNNSVSAARSITINDDIAPVFNFTPANEVISCQAEMNFGTPIIYDNCDNTSLTYQDETVAGNCPGHSFTTRTWTATDQCGNTTTASKTIEVNDSSNPVFTYAPQDFVIDCNTTPTFGTPIVEDACGQVNLTFTDVVSEGDCTTGYTMTRTWLAIDECGNEAEVAQTIIVSEETTVAFANVPSNQLINCDAEMNFGTPIIATNCGEDTQITYNDVMVEGNCSTSYAVTRTWSATLCNITITAEATITVEDTQLPIFDMLPSNKEIACGETPQFDTPLYSDNCSAVEISHTDATATNDCEVATTRTWIITDACGNSATTNQTITSIDSDAPIFTSTPQDLVINCSTTPVFGTPTVEDNCGQVNLTFNDVTSAGDCSSGYTITRTWMAIDNCGNEVETSQMITVVDDTETTVAFANIPSDQLINCGTEMNFGTPEITTNCADEAEITFEDVMTEGTCTASYAITRTWTATLCNITVTAEATITVEDNQLPTFDMLPENKVIACGETPQFDTPLFSDNCSSVELTHTDATATNNCEIATTRTWTIVDACGNMATANQTITSIDSNAPVFTSNPQDFVIDCNTTPTFGTPTVEDNCGQVNLTFNDETSVGDCSTGYTITRTWLAIDACGNEETVSQMITVSEETTVAFANVPSDQFINCSDEMNFGTPEIATNCSDEAEITFEDVMTEGTCAASYAVTRTWTATLCNITVTADATITIEDNQIPTFDFLPEDKIIDCSETPQFDAPLYSDNCSTVEISHTDATATNNCEVATTRTWTIVDACGNTATANQIITAMDSDAPVFISVPQDFVIDCNTTPTFGTPTIEDNCGQVNLTFNDETSVGDCSTGYTITRTWLAIDACGNEETVSQTITVSEETTVAFANVPSDQFINCSDEMNFGTPEIATNCSDEAEITFEDVMIEGTCAASYVVTRTWTATLCNITVTAEATITIEDNQIPTFDTSPTDKYADCGETIDFDTPLFSDNCSAVDISHTDATATVNCEVATTRTWTIADACGNVATTAQTITHNTDVDAPSFEQIPQGGNISCEGNFEFGQPIVLDNCSEINVTYNDEVQQGSCDIGYSFTRTWTATDGCGNLATAQQTFVVENDNSAPQFTFVPADEELVCVTTPIFGDAIATDACSNVTMTFEDHTENTDCSVAQIHTRTWTAIDDCGNVTQAVQKLTVLPDTDAPVFNFVPQDEVLDCNAVVEDNFGIAEVSDNCGIEVTMTFEDVTSELECGLMITRTWSAIDNCGNVATASKSITIEDSAQPIITFAPENKVLECSTELPLETATFTDNCDADFNVTFEETTEQLTCGYIVYRSWTAVDDCNNVTVVNQTIEVTDNAAPIFDITPSDQEMSYDEFFNFEVPPLIAQDDCSNPTISEPIISDNDDCDDFKYFITWTASDACGNITEHRMTIPIKDAVMEVAIDAPIEMVEGNTNLLTANVDFGLAPYTYDWTILEGDNWTLDADGNLADISAGNTDATFEVKVTDAHGCSTSTIVEVASNQIITTTEFFEILPNPTFGDLNINYTSEIETQSVVTIYDVLGRRLHTWKFDAAKGINNNQIDVTPLADATYFITVKVGERLYTSKFLKLD